MAFIIDTYNKYDSFDRQHTRHTFFINDIQYAIKEVELQWGQPILPLRINAEQQPYYNVYATLQEAMAFAKSLR